MLTRLKVSNFLLIEQLELDFSTGLTVVTGETGSGKSIIIDALMLLFGAKVAKDVIRINQKQAVVEAEFNLSSQQAITWLINNDLASDNQSYVICRRIIDNLGKNKIYINGHTVVSSQIKTLKELVLDIHTQHASIALLKSEIQRNLLDEYAGIIPKTYQLALLFKLISETEYKLQNARSKVSELDTKRQNLLDLINELGELNLGINEWENLNNKHKELASASNILSELNFAENLLNMSDNSLIKQISQLHSRLSKIALHLPKLDELIALISSVEIELKECCYLVETIANSIEDNPNKITEVEARIHQIFQLSRKYGVYPEEIANYLKSCQNEFDVLMHDSNISQLEQELLQLKGEYGVIAREVSDVRLKSATDMESKITKYLHQLGITGEFKVALDALTRFNNYGLENIEFQVCFNKGMPFQPLIKVASGGELSRVALAIYLLLSVHNPPEIIIFDEIDVGIGGKVASVVGDMLHKIGKTKQVICITHQPQTASCGDNHIAVSKKNDRDVTHIEVGYVTGEDRVDEISRMLGGATITAVTISHAQEMLSNRSIIGER